MPVLMRVSVSRKVSQDFQSRGFSLDITSELPASAVENPQQMAEASQHLFQLAEDLLEERVRHGEVDSPPARLVRQSNPVPAATTGSSRLNGRINGNGHAGHPTQQANQPRTAVQNGKPADRAITDAQARALNRMAERLDSTGERIAQEEHGCSLNQLSMKQASALIDSLKRSLEAQHAVVRQTRSR